MLNSDDEGNEVADAGENILCSALEVLARNVDRSDHIPHLFFPWSSMRVCAQEYPSARVIRNCVGNDRSLSLAAARAS